MPELPEVETIRRDLSKKILNKKITNIKIKKNKIVKSNNQQFKKILNNNYFSNINRIGKLLIFKLKNKNKYLLIHLKMTGQLIYKDKNQIIAGGHVNPADKLPGKYTHVIFNFSDKSNLFFNDLRQFGYLKLVNEKELAEIKFKFGPEPLTKQFTLKKLAEIIKTKKTPIKAVLLNQNLIAGLGNIYVDESLFAAQINPTKKSNKLTDKQIKKLHSAINKIIKKAIKYRGTTFNNYVDAEGRQGNFIKLLKVYHRDGKMCTRCKKNTIKKIKTAGRGTHFCPKCQKL